MTDDTPLHPDPELQRCPETGLWPGTWRSPSQRRQHRPDLEREACIIWVMPEAEARRLPWLRERFGRPSPRQRGLVARSTTRSGRSVRFWTSTPEDRDAYQRLLQAGAGTAPIEAVWPPSIAAGHPAQPAHPHLLPLLWQAIAEAEGAPVVLPFLEPDPASEAEKVQILMQAFWRGLAPEPEAASHG